jgi:hypothetical protein
MGQACWGQLILTSTHSHPLTSPMGASRYSKDLLLTSPATLFPTPPLLPASWTITILPVFLTASASAGIGSGLIVRISISWMDGAGLGGCSLAGRKGINEGGGDCSSSIARTIVSVIPRSLTASIQRHPVRHQCQIPTLTYNIHRTDRKCVIVHRHLLDCRAVPFISASISHLQYLWLEEQSRTWVANSREQQAFGLYRGTGYHHLETCCTKEKPLSSAIPGRPHLWALRMV